MPTREEIRLARKAVDRAIVDRYSRGETIVNLCLEFDCSHARIRAALDREMTCEAREAAKRRNYSKASSKTQDQLYAIREERNKQVIDMYLETDLSVAEIGERFNMSGANVYTISRHAGYRSRDRKINKDE